MRSRHGSAAPGRDGLVSPAQRVAVLGGDGRMRPEGRWGAEVVHFKSPRDGGNGEARRLEAALRAGAFDLLVVLTRWNSHSVTRKLRSLCRRLGIRVAIES